MTDDNMTDLILRGTTIRTDDADRVCLNDLWEAAGGTSGQTPPHWRRTEPAKALETMLQKKIGNPDVFGKVVHAQRGRGKKGTFAHPILAAAYAGYLDTNLEIEMRETWLRFRAGDPTLADEILQRATAEANHWAGVRALGRAQRNSYTDVLKEHGVEGRGYMECTESLYIHLLGGRSYEIRNQMNLPPKTNLREHLDTSKLSYVMAAEALAAERIEEEDRKGNRDCAEATALSARAIERAVNDDRKNRQQRMVG